MTVCLLEAGPSDVGDANVLVLEDWMHLLDSGYDWDYPVEPQENGNSFLRHARPRCSAAVPRTTPASPSTRPPRASTRGRRSAARAGARTASCRSCAVEDNAAGGPHHGTSGPVRLRDVPPNDPCGVALLQAAASAGLPTVQFNRGSTVRNGAGWFQINAGEDGSRMSTSHAYLHPVMDSRPNLTVRTGYWVEKLVLEPGPDGRPRATGVQFLRPTGSTTVQVRARREVVLSAGSIDTPKLLMLSGVGPAAQLKEFGLDVLVDSPGWGRTSTTTSRGSCSGTRCSRW